MYHGVLNGKRTESMHERTLSSGEAELTLTNKQTEMSSGPLDFKGSVSQNKQTVFYGYNSKCFCLWHFSISFSPSLYDS